MNNPMVVVKIDNESGNPIAFAVNYTKGIGLGVIQNSSEFKDFTYSLNFGFLRGFKNTIDLEGEKRNPLIKTELDLTIERKSKRFFTSLAMIFAIVVFPTPGGPQKIMEGILPE